MGPDGLWSWSRRGRKRGGKTSFHINLRVYLLVTSATISSKELLALGTRGEITAANGIVGFN